MSKDQEKKDDAGTKAAPDEAKSVEAAPAPATEAIEEDDAFEEFEPSAWGAHEEDAEDVQQWQVCASACMVVWFLLFVLWYGWLTRDG